MSGSWHPSVEGFGFANGACRGHVAAAPPARSVRGELISERCPGTALGFELGRLRFRDPQGVEQSVRATPAEAFVQEPQLVVRPLVETMVGLQLALRFHTISDGLEGEMRVQTVEPVETLFQDLIFRAPGFEISFPLASGKPRSMERLDAATSRVASFSDGAGPGFFLLAEAGEQAEAALEGETGAAGQLVYRLFGRPLEKGVILVARFALCVADPVPAPEKRADFDRAWRRQTPFL